MSARNLMHAFLPPWKLAGCGQETPVLVGLSGGADSVALTDLLAERAKTDGFALTAVHVHHGIRGGEADRDAAFCRAFAERRGVPFLLVRVDVPAQAESSGESLEAAARTARYRAFEAVMRERNIPLLATAHHADDNAETVLFRLCRGAGLGGLCGIPAVRQLAWGTVTRPLLPFRKEELLAYCRDRGLDFVTDSTNLTPCCARNILRLEVLPALERAVPGAAATVARTAESLRADADCLDGLAAEWTQAHRTDGALMLDGFSALHPALRARVLGNYLGGAEAVHIAEAEKKALAGSGRVALPGDRFASVSGGRLRIYPHLRGEGLTAPRPFSEGAFAICDGKLTVSVRRTEKCRKTTKVHSLSTTHYIIQTDKSVIINQFFWRAAQEGDRLQRGDRAVRCCDLWRERGVPATVRRYLPVLCNADGAIVWVPFGEPERVPAGEQPAGRIYEITVALGETGREIHGGNGNVRNQQGY